MAGGLCQVVVAARVGNSGSLPGRTGGPPGSCQSATMAGKAGCSPWDTSCDQSALLGRYRREPSWPIAAMLASASGVLEG